MNNVRSAPLKRATPVSTTAGAGCAVLIGIVLLLVSVGPLIILLNGGYSILGMAWLADKVGPYGRMFWSVATFWTVRALADGYIPYTGSSAAQAGRVSAEVWQRRTVRRCRSHPDTAYALSVIRAATVS
jgi:hypothetical protein